LFSPLQVVSFITVSKHSGSAVLLTTLNCQLPAVFAVINKKESCMMKLLLGVGLLVLVGNLVTSGSSTVSTADNTVPEELVTDESTYWTISTLSTINYVNKETGPYYNTVTNGGGMIVKYKFLPGNRYLFQLYVQANTYNIRTETWTEVEGTVEFTKDEEGRPIFITTAEKGLYRMINNGNTKERAITDKELEEQHSGRCLWKKAKLKDDSNNIYLLIVDLKAHPDGELRKEGGVYPSYVSKFHIPVDE
jgi:hypothetical protein